MRGHFASVPSPLITLDNLADMYEYPLNECSKKHCTNPTCMTYRDGQVIKCVHFSYHTSLHQWQHKLFISAEDKDLFIYLLQIVLT